MQMGADKEVKKAIALSYQGEKAAPCVIATGSGHVAENILSQAKEKGIPVYEDKKLATILGTLELGEMIPEELYELVARILVFVGDMDDLYERTQKGQQ